LKDNHVKDIIENIMPKINKILEVHLSWDGKVGGEKIVWPSSFLTCCHNSGPGCRNVILHGDHYCDMTGGQINSVDSPEQVGVVDLPPFVVGKQATHCRRGRIR